jgi:hypothetical protein
MPEQDKKLKLLKAKIAVALQDEYQRVPTEQEIDTVFHLIRMLYKARLRPPLPPEGAKKSRAAGDLLNLHTLC